MLIRLQDLHVDERELMRHVSSSSLLQDIERLQFSIEEKLKNVNDYDQNFPLGNFFFFTQHAVVKAREAFSSER